VTDFLVSPSRNTSWRMNPDEFASRLRERWAQAEVTEEDEDLLSALRFVIPFEDGRTLTGYLMRDGQVVELNGDVSASAETAVWVRQLVPDEQELIFWDEGYNVDVPLTEGIRPGDIVSAVEAATEA
jgi:hypothetical protein